jgi:hypothetical protein
VHEDIRKCNQRRRGAGGETLPKNRCSNSMNLATIASPDFRSAFSHSVRFGDAQGFSEIGHRQL